MTAIVTGSRDLRAHCDAYRKDRSGSSFVLLSLYGETTMVRGLTAHALSHGAMRVHGFSNYASTSEDTSYSVLTQSIGEGLTHTVIVDRRATNVASSWDNTLFVVGSDLQQAKEGWVSRFGRRCRVPIKHSWGPRLWDLGVEEKLIDTCEGFGLGVWYVSLDHDRWQQVISKAVLDGVLDD